MKSVLKTATHSIKVHASATVGVPIEKVEKDWASGELSRTDSIMAAGDYPDMDALKAYRQALYIHPDKNKLPKVTRPEL
jgi:hypothetical protein